MTRVFFRTRYSPYEGTINQQMHDKIDQIEHVLSEIYCYGLDNYDNYPPKYIVILDEEDNAIYNGKIVIPKNEEDKLYLEPHLTENQKNNILSNEFVIVKEIPDEFGADTDIEDEYNGGGKCVKKTRRYRKRVLDKKRFITSNTLRINPYKMRIQLLKSINKSKKYKTNKNNKNKKTRKSKLN